MIEKELGDDCPTYYGQLLGLLHPKHHLAPRISLKTEVHIFLIKAIKYQATQRNL